MFENSRVKKWLGPLWWYTLILFCIQRAGDLINAFVGLYLVPKYVPQAELGAVLPLAQIGGALGLPLAILSAPFAKYLNTYATHGELGKVKSLLRDAFALQVIAFVGLLVYARFFMPIVFERMRVQDGRLGTLVVVSGVVGAFAPVFTSALQALKKFRAMAICGLLTAPVRLSQRSNDRCNTGPMLESCMVSSEQTSELCQSYLLWLFHRQS